MSISVGLYFFVFRMADDYLYVRFLYNIIIHDILGATDAKWTKSFYNCKNPREDEDRS